MKSSLFIILSLFLLLQLVASFNMRTALPSRMRGVIKKEIRSYRSEQPKMVVY